MGRTACTEPQCLYKGALYLTNNCCQHNQQQTYYIAKLQILLSKLRPSVDFILKVTVMFTLEQATKVRGGGRSIDLLFL